MWENEHQVELRPNSIETRNQNEKKCPAEPTIPTENHGNRCKTKREVMGVILQRH
jgi:hypothetical protein